jgi:phosphatidylglycerophosphate synthase
MSGDFERAYRLWTYAHSAVLFLATLLMSPVFLITEEIFLWFLAPYALASIFWLYTIAGWGERSPADALTGSRGVGAALLFLWAALLPQSTSLAGGGARWLLLAVLSLVEITDFFDGRLARRRGFRSFGAVWDMENDALFIFALTLVGWVHLGFPFWALAIGLMRYVYFLAFRVTGDPPGYPAAYKWFAKSVAALIAVSLLVSYVPGLPELLIRLLLAPVLLLQAASFGWDLLLQVRAGRVRMLTEDEIPRKMETWR